MLKTNSKKASENIRAYIIANFDPSSYDEYKELNNTTDFSVVAETVYKVFRAEGYNKIQNNATELEAFTDYMQGLPTIFNGDYYYNVSAVDLLATLLEETDNEKAKYNEREAEAFLTRLIYREIKKAID